MKWLAFLVCLSSQLFADDPYHTLLQQYPKAMGRSGSWKSGEIEVITSPAEIKNIEEQVYNRLVRKGFSEEEAKKSSRIGIIAEDQYWIWVRDAVIFPGGFLGTYNRIFWKCGLTGPNGVIIFPLLPNKKVVVNVNFRHATRSWEVEIPRGLKNDNETLEQTAARKLQSETGYVANQFILLGHLAADSGVLANTIPVFLGHLNEKKQRNPDKTEAIAKSLALSLEELSEAFIKGYLIVDIQGVKTKAYCRDPFLTYALMQATWQKQL